MFSLKDYYDNFVDKSLPTSWKLSRSASGGLDLQLPNGVEVKGDLDQWDWGQTFARDDATSRLWYHSFLWLPFVSKTLLRDDLTINIIEDYIDWLNQRALDPQYVPFNSQDHAHAIQIRSACALISREYEEISRGELGPLVSTAVNFLEALAPVVFQEKYMLPNNHGLMLSRAFLEAGYILGRINRAGTLSHQYTRRAYDGISFVIERVFDEEGIVNENTPAYQGLYIDIISSIIRFQKKVDNSDSQIINWENLIIRATENLELMLWADNRYPPLGDDTGEKSRFTARSGTLFSKENGCYFFKDDQVELSIICGYRGIVHKHADDTSVRLRFKGRDLLMDAGLLSYDMNDPLAVVMSTQRGHSGLFYRRFDKFRGQELYFAKPPRVVSDIEKIDFDNGTTSIRCRASTDRDWQVERLYTLSGNRLTLEDSYKCPEGEESPVQRFLIHEEASVEIAGSTAIIEHGDVNLVIETESAASINLVSGLVGENLIGWRAAQRYLPVPCHVIEIDFPSEVSSLKTTLEWIESSSEITSKDYANALKSDKYVKVEFEGVERFVPQRIVQQEFIESEENFTPKRRISLSAASALLKELSTIHSAKSSWIMDFSASQPSNGFLLGDKDRDVLLMASNSHAAEELTSLLNVNQSDKCVPQPLILSADVSWDYSWLDQDQPGLLILDESSPSVNEILSAFSGFTVRPMVLFFGGLRAQVSFTASHGGEGIFLPYLSYADGGLLLLPDLDQWDKAVHSVLTARFTARNEIGIRDLRYRNSLFRDQIGSLEKISKGDKIE